MSEETTPDTEAPTHDDVGFPIGKRSELQDLIISFRKQGGSWKEAFQLSAHNHNFTGTLGALKESCKNANGGKLPEPEKPAPVEGEAPAVSKKPTRKAKSAKKPAKKSSGEAKARVSKGKAKPKAKKPAKGKGKAKKPSTQRAKRKDGELSCLEAAEKVLKASKRPMNSIDITAEMIAKGYWSSNGATPSQTISGAIQREIKDKGKESRFKKVDRGLYVAA
jgi:outer membrane biosynthesis protein TonB